MDEDSHTHRINPQFPHSSPPNQLALQALLHDIGKLALRFFFRDHFGKLLDQAKKSGSSFREAESVLSETVNHEYLGAFLVPNASGGPNLVKSVATHHCPERAPVPWSAWYIGRTIYVRLWDWDISLRIRGVTIKMYSKPCKCD